MTPSQTTDPKDFEKDELLFNPVLEESINQSDKTNIVGNYADKEKIIVNPNSDSDKKPEGFHISKKAMIGAATLAAVMIAAGAFAIISNSDKKGRITTSNSSDNPIEENETSTNGTNVAVITDTDITISPTESTIITPQETANQTTASATSETTTSAETQIDYKKPTFNVVEGYSFETLSEDQQAELKKLEAMSIDEFRDLSETDQLKFAYWVYINNNPRFEYIMKNNNLNLTYVENPQTAEDFVANNAYMLAFSAALRTYNGDPSSGLQPDSLTAKKMAIMSYSASDSHYSGWDSTMESMQNVGGIPYPTQEVETFLKGQDYMIINMYNPGNETLTVEEDAQHIQQKYQLITFKDIFNNDVTVGYCVLTISQTDAKAIKITSNS